MTVALSGLGGDELAAGYERHRGALLGGAPALDPGLRAPGAAPAPRRRAPGPARAATPGASASSASRAPLELPFDERYFELLSQLSRAARESLLTPAFREQIDLDEPRAHFQRALDPRGRRRTR